MDENNSIPLNSFNNHIPYNIIHSMDNQQAGFNPNRMISEESVAERTLELQREHSYLENYFTISIDNKCRVIATCTQPFCGIVLKMQHQTVFNLKRHYRHKHPGMEGALTTAIESRTKRNKKRTKDMRAAGFKEVTDVFHLLMDEDFEFQTNFAKIKDTNWVKSSLITSGLYFTVIKCSSNLKVSFKCVLCPQDPPSILLADVTTSSNLRKHMVRRHPEFVDGFDEARRCRQKKTRPRRSSGAGTNQEGEGSREAQWGAVPLLPQENLGLSNGILSFVFNDENAACLDTSNLGHVSQDGQHGESLSSVPNLGSIMAAATTSVAADHRLPAATVMDDSLEEVVEGVNHSSTPAATDVNTVNPKVEPSTASSLQSPDVSPHRDFNASRSLQYRNDDDFAMPEPPENYQLKHNNHVNMILSQLAEDETFMDMTLSAQGKNIKAHKSVLSAVSPYFSRVLRDNPCQHPIVIMPLDITYNELSNMIMYIYRGEITVSASDLPSLLKTAQVLEINGLSDSTFSPNQLFKNASSNGKSTPQANIPGTNFPPSSLSSSSESLANNSGKSMFNGNIKTSPPKSVSTNKSNIGMNARSTSEKTSSDCTKSNFTMEEETDSNEHPMINPTDFMDLDMTCVKEELQSDNEEDHPEAMDSSSTPKEVTTPPPIQHPPLAVSPKVPSRSKNDEVTRVEEQKKNDLEKVIKQQNSLKTLANLANMNSSTPSPASSCDNDDENVVKDKEETKSVEKDQSPNICPYCSSYVNTNELQTHMSTKHAIKPSFICSECNRVYTRKLTYEIHSKKCPDRT